MVFDEVKKTLRESPRRWLVTGAAGFIGSNLTEELLSLDQEVVAFDNFATGYQKNIQMVKDGVSPRQGERLHFIEGDIRDEKACKEAVRGVDFVLHQAALGSVPRSIVDPKATDEVNVHGFVNMAFAAKEAGVKRFVYASSSSVYGDCDDKIKVEERVGKLLSPYAVSKMTNELYAQTFSDLYGTEMVGLRYFNVFGPRQDPDGVYAAVIPKWIHTLLSGGSCVIYGDGSTSRDFCYVKNVVQANILSAVTPQIRSEILNIACGASTSLLQLYAMIVELLEPYIPGISTRKPQMEDFRSGDIRYSLANISRASEAVGYQVTQSVLDGLRQTMPWYVEHARS